jgi:uncharacterized protein YxjI
MKIISICRVKAHKSKSSEENMNPIFQFPKYLLKRQAIALTGRFRVYDPMGNLVLFSEQKMFRLREDIRVYSDENKTQEVLSIKARQIVDFSAAYDVVDAAYNQKVGALRRKGLSSILRDEWQVLDVNDNLVGNLLRRQYPIGAPAPSASGFVAASKLRYDLRRDTCS